MTGRLFSLVAIPLALLGHLLFWGGSSTLLLAQAQFGVQRGIDVGALLLTVLGIVIILAAVATVAIGSLGAYVVGGVQVVFSLLFHLLPFGIQGPSFAPAFDLMNAVRSFSAEVSDGMYFYFPPGAGVVTGAVFIGAGLAAAQRRSADASATTRMLSAAAGLVGVLGVGLALAGGGGAYLAQLMMLRPAQPLDLVMLYGGAVLVAAAVAVGRWSTTGALVAGGIVTVGALVSLAVPQAIFPALRGSSALLRAFEVSGPSGTLLLIGLALLVAGLATRWRTRRRVPAELPPPSTAPVGAPAPGM